MAEARLCPHCSAWMCAGNDRWCGSCGESCAQLRLTLQPAVLLAGNLAGKVCLRIGNPTCAPLLVSSITAPAWLKIAPWGPLEIDVYGVSPPIWAVADTLLMEEACSGTILVSTSAGPVSADLDVVEETPSLRVTPELLEVWPSGTTARKPVPLMVHVQSGVLRVSAIRPSAGGGLVVVEPLTTTLAVTEEQGASVLLVPDAAALRGKSTTSVLLDYQGPNGERTLEIRLPVAERKAPQVSWKGQLGSPLETFRASRQKVSLVLENKEPGGQDGGAGNAELIIKSVTLMAPAEVGKVDVTRNFLLPMQLKGGAAVTLDFELNLEGVQPRPKDLYHFTIVVDTNARSFQRQVGLFIRPMRPFDGVLAIDFGSSNTTCAIWEYGLKPELLPLEATEAVAPTFIRYENLADQHVETEIGTSVKELAALDEVAAAATLSRLKQRLGSRLQDLPVRPKGSALWTTRTAAEAVADYLHQVREAAERAKGRTFSEFILTHPAVCSLSQYRNLHRALIGAFGSTQPAPVFLQEPVAALIPFLLRHAEAAAANPVSGRAPYTVASLDLGGGTTDVAVLRVEYRQVQGGALEVMPRIVSCQGVQFGGEDLTDYLTQKLADRVQTVLSADMPGALLVRADSAAAATEEILYNSAVLRRAAEGFKTSLSAERGASAKAPTQLILRIQPSAGSEGQNRSFPFEKIRDMRTTPSLQGEFLAFAEAKVKALAAVLASNAGTVEHLDFIQLSGKTSFLPIVEQVVRQAFPTAKIERAPDPKECVVIGACLSRSMRQSSKLRLVLPSGAQRTTSSIGVKDADTGDFTAILPLDTDIPPEGLMRERATGWMGDEPVTLWESLGSGSETVGSADHAGFTRRPQKLGTWKPHRTMRLADGARWALRLTLKDFAIDVRAVGPNGEQVLFSAPEDMD